MALLILKVLITTVAEDILIFFLFREKAIWSCIGFKCEVSLK